LNYTDEQRMAEIQFKIQVMDMISPLMVGTGLWVLLGIWVVFLIRIYQERAWLVFILAFGWGLGAQWFVRANINYRWVDEPELYVLHEALLKAIEQGQSELSMDSIWNERWQYVCIAPMYMNNYWHEGGDITIQQALGVESSWGLQGYETEEIFLGNGKDFFSIETKFGRFFPKIFKKYSLHEYRKRLKGQGYDLDFVSLEHPVKEYIKGCYTLNNMSIKIKKR